MKFIRDRIARDKKNAGRKRGVVRSSSKPLRALSKPAPPRKPSSKPAHNNTHARTGAGIGSQQKGHVPPQQKGHAPPQQKGHVSPPLPPVVRLRTLLIGLGALAVCMAGPLALVWKQSYINQVSIRLEGRAETLKVLSGEITSLKLERTRLSAAPRIERIARGRGLEYPSSEQIVILDVGPAGLWNDDGLGGFIARVKSFILGERG